MIQHYAICLLNAAMPRVAIWHATNVLLAQVEQIRMYVVGVSVVWLMQFCRAR